MKKLTGALITGAFFLTAQHVYAAETYTVKSGDTLWSIGDKTNVTVSQLKTLNNLKSNTIYVGQTLKLSNTASGSSTTTQTTYTVKSGDTLYRVATQYNLSVSQLKTLNNLKSDFLYVGQKLVVKSGTTTTTPSTPSTTTTTYKVVTGDTLYSIATKYKMTVTQLKTLNNITSNVISVGQVLKVTGTATSTPEVEVVKGTVTASVLNVRKGAGTGYGIAGTLVRGTQVTVLSQSGSWAKIQYGSITGYVSLDYLTITKGTGDTGSTPSSPNGKIVILDPGHGGGDPGTIAKDGTKEKSYNWEYTQKIKAELQSRGYTVYETRGNDTSCIARYVGSASLTPDLQCRVDFAKAKRGDIYISIHHNAFNGVARGTETFYNATPYSGDVNDNPSGSRRLGQLIHKEMVAAIGSLDRGVHDKGYYVNRKATMPSVLIEGGFIDNGTDLAKIKSNATEDRVAQGIADAVDTYFGR